MILKKTGLKFTAVFSLILTFILTTSCESKPEFAEEWSQYRGPNRDGISETKIPVNIWTDAKPLTPVWKQKIGDGFSGIVVNGDQIITAFAEDSSEVIASYNRKTGKETWRCNIGKEFVEEFGNGPRATPTLDGNQVFIYNSWGHIFAVDTKTGNLNWKLELSDSLKIKMPLRGHCTSPIVVGENLIVHAGGRTENTAFIALDKKTGAIKWQTGETTISYSSPVIANINNVDQLIFTTTRLEEVEGKRKAVFEAVGMTPDGKKLWTGPSVSAVIAMPLFIPPNKIFISSSDDTKGCILIEVKHNGSQFSADTVWHSLEMQNHFNSSVYYKGYIYGFSNATLHCLDVKTGERKWRKRGYGKGSLIIADNKLLILTDRGKFVLAETNPEKFVELSKAKVIEGLTWTSPTFADGKLYLRSREEMACYDLTK